MFSHSFNGYTAAVRKNFLANIFGADDQAVLYKQACQSAVMAAHCYALIGGEEYAAKDNMTKARQAFQEYYDATVQAEHLRYNGSTAPEVFVYVSCPTPDTEARLSSERRELEAKRH